MGKGLRVLFKARLSKDHELRVKAAFEAAARRGEEALKQVRKPKLVTEKAAAAIVQTGEWVKQLIKF